MRVVTAWGLGQQKPQRRLWRGWASSVVLAAPLVPWPLFGHCLSGHGRFALCKDELKPADRASIRGRKREAEEGFGWVLLELFFTCKKSLCCTCSCFAELPLEEQSVPAVRADSERQAEALLQAAPSLLGVLQAAGADVGLESETGEVRQVPKHWDSVSGGGGEFLLRPSGCCASAWQWSWCVSGLFLHPPG